VKIDNFFAELKRRNVYKVALAYAVVSWELTEESSRTTSARHGSSAPAVRRDNDRDGVLDRFERG
jgi:hypothetical protein